MTRGERLCYQRRTALWTVALLLFLGGAIGGSWLLIDRDRIADERAALATELAEEADLRGRAVSTLASDVRQLRSQIQADGETPDAPDPEQAIKDLPDRAEVPVPIPGPPGPKGDKGDAGKAAPTIIPSPGAPGAPGQPGGDSTVPGPQGPQGQPGADSTVPGPQGERGEAGPPPSGYTLYDPDGTVYECTQDGDGSTHYTCRTTSTPEPSSEPQGQGRGLLGIAAFAMTATYRRL
ncbi:collagen-like protein [Streptomyces sp. NBC_01373]|uniref:collagen-like protein n=1 Tax=Streptomyces sp. NBC_01373 TaxID=2903843 RepID=UPI00225575A0|nr:collagen-like protein [Streptomyces sp. NBC_01373]MCX4704384.1 collagen-like protein [Streptomyces sp. NBC_01373]MCX4707124.1 collagen-like protein [Streptomyces sp. NBC_01373]